MSLSIWRYAHLVLAIFSSLFLFITSTTGAILAYDAAREKINTYKVNDLDKINISDFIQKSNNSFVEITEIAVDYNDVVCVEGLDKNNNSIRAYVNPITGEIVGFPKEKSEFINWITSLHRSLFLKEIGRFTIGLISFILFFISISGFILIIKRQQGIRNFFDNIKNDSFWQYFHVISGRLLILPIIIISLTGAFLFMLRFNLISKSENEKIEPINTDNNYPKEIHEFKIFNEILLKDVKKIEFPFSDDIEDFFVLKLKDEKIYINQITGKIEWEEKYPLSTIYQELSLSIHTGRGSVVWSIVLGLSSINIIFFIYSGFTISIKRTRNKINNKYKVEDSEFIILIGSENGSTLSFASNIHSQLLSLGKKSYISELNSYKIFPKAKYILIFTSTYGLGTAPTNAKNFENNLQKITQKQNIKYSVIGFGSKSYDNFCNYAVKINNILSNKTWAQQYLDLFTVNDKSTSEFCNWVKAWNEKSGINLATNPSLYNQKTPALKKMKIFTKSEVFDDNYTFKILLTPLKKQKFRSGDFLAIYPDNDHKERLYSIGKINEHIQLIVKFHDKGLGSRFLYNLKENEKIKARIIKNSNFNIPEKAKKVIMIANGTGIAPFLGMIEENTKKREFHLYCGFRKKSIITQGFQYYAMENLKKGKLKKFCFTYSQNEKKQYVTDLIKRDYHLIMNILNESGYIMICGSVKMQEDIMNYLNILYNGQNKNFQDYKNQILVDCY